MTTTARDFICDECNAFPGEPCVYMWPYGSSMWNVGSIYFWPGQYIPYPFWNRYQPYLKQLETWLRGLRIGRPEESGELTNLAIEERLARVPAAAARVGTPTLREHNARRNALWRWEQQTERQVLNDYLGEWLSVNGGIFQAGRAG